MKFVKPNFWQTKNLISSFLFPLTGVTSVINIFKNIVPKKKFLIKTICVGNIYLGGTGKTSLTIEIQKLLSKKFKTVFIKKNYLNQLDEIKLLNKKGKVISNNNREKALTLASKKKFNLAILDDGLQQKNIEYGVKIICFNSKEGLGNGWLLPAGPLRENINQLKKYDIAFINGEKKNSKLLSKLKTVNKNLIIFKGKYKPTNLDNFNLNKNYLMFCGIGNPHEFEKTLTKNKFSIKEKVIFPDHYKITKKELDKLKQKAKKNKLTLITTEKDFYRLDKLEKKNVKFLKVKLEIDNIKNFKKILQNKL